MDTSIVKNAVGTLDKMLSQARHALWQLENEVFGYPGYGPNEVYENSDSAMEFCLQELYDVLVIVLEAAGMPETRSSLIKAWDNFKSENEGLRHVIHDDESNNLYSPALTFVERLMQGLQITMTREISSEAAWTLNRLEAMLRDTPALVHRRGVLPENEMELQKIMHDYLSACFSDFRFNPQIGGTLKNFKPDCGIASAGAAIEFKFVKSKEEMAIAFSGVAEDTAGYKGSKDWTRFYAVIYQTQPETLESHLRSDMKRIGAARWIPILVHAPADKKPAKKTKAANNSNKIRV
jgi:hypothetical protein